ncbi:MAG: NAD-dependent protein deacylase [Clostridia bacterium]|nr:NAD-dependent protein deacylase [Clostridia bacterium]
MAFEEEKATLRRWVTQAKRIVFFGGAGVSTESGIPDFRSVNGLYRQQYAYPPEEILSHSFFMANPQEFFRFYRAKMLCPDAQPNAAHRRLAEWEKCGKLSAVVTQNIDGLHQKAGSRHVCELHGSVLRNHCLRCGKFYSVETILRSEGVPRCDCGGIIKPDVVLYEESLDEAVMEDALTAIRTSDLLIIGGTSLTVYPAAGFIHYFQGDHLVLINRDPTPQDRHADLLIRDPIGRTLEEIDIEM